MRPHVVLHNQASLDSRIDFLEADLGIFYGIASLFNEDATLVGCDTILAAYEGHVAEGSGENTAEVVNDGEDKRPLLVVTDSKGRLRCWPALKKEQYWRDGIALCSRSTPADHISYLEEMGVASIVAGNGQVDLREALEQLNRSYGVEVVRVDSGGSLNGALLRAGLVDEVSLLINPTLVGGVSPRTIFHAPDLISADGLMRLSLKHMETLDGDVVWLRYDAVT
jgi:2,5-diamino-6-(ribosylamino)-4(3H)-pyrimidinone 5'-phosphate reductase